MKRHSLKLSRKGGVVTKNFYEDTRQYQKLASLRRKNAQLLTELEGYKRERLAGSVDIILGMSHAFGPYRIRKRRARDLIVGSKRPKHLLTVPLDTEPDLFLRFAELPTTKEAYQSFVSRYGLLGLREQQGYAVDWDEHEEPLMLFTEFHLSFKRALNNAKDYVQWVSQGDLKRLLDTTAKRQSLPNWLDWHLSSHTRLVVTDLSGRIALHAKTLAGALILQLYRFLVVRQELRVCALPECDVLTTRKKFCSAKHQKLFNTWKRRGKVVLRDGVWRRTPT